MNSNLRFEEKQLASHIYMEEMLYAKALNRVSGLKSHDIPNGTV